MADQISIYRYNANRNATWNERAFTVSCDIEEAMRLFEDLNVNEKNIRMNLMRVVGRGARASAKRSAYDKLHRRSGNLKKSFRYVLGWGGKHIEVYNAAESGKNTSKDHRMARYAFMLAKGYTIKPRANDMTRHGSSSSILRFQVNGQWVGKKQVTVPPIDFLEPPVERYLDSGDCKASLDKALQKQMEYWEKRSHG